MGASCNLCLLIAVCGKIPRKEAVPLETFKKIWNVGTSILVILAILLAFAFVGVRLIGFDVYAVLSGSMEPNIPVGSLIYVKEVDPATLQKGDVITYLVAENTVVTHRIEEVVPDKEDPTVLRFRTKGDANNTADEGAVHERNIIGKQTFHIPYLGYVSSYIQHPPGTYVAIFAGVALILLTFVPDLLPSKKEEQ